jgi:putative membrane protein insertion efficiency factor
MARADRLLAVAAIAVIAAYRRLVSPVVPRACRFVPTCSDYATQALRKHGAVKGGLVALRRLLRCHPFGGSGLDPVR